jgi:hypothetical protein
MRTNRLAYTLNILVALALHPCIGSAQQTMSPEDEAIYRQMIKSQGVDPAAVKSSSKKVEASRKWTDAKGGLIHYHIEGVFQGQVNVVGGSNWIGYADVTDRVVIELDWKLSESKLAGTPQIQNAKSTVRNPRNPEPKCLPPVLRGEYEHYDLLGIKNGLGGALEFQVRTAYPVVEVAQMCTGSRVKVPASVKTRPESFVMLSPVLLDSQVPDSDNLRISKDRKSMIHKQAGWTWTFTPSVKK